MCMCLGVFPPAGFDVDEQCACGVGENVGLLTGSKVAVELSKNQLLSFEFSYPLFLDLCVKCHKVKE